MKAAIVSDTHDNIWKLEEAMLHLKASDAIIHCGDLVSPFMVRILAEGVGDTPVHLVWGNNEGDTYLIGKVAQGYPNVQLHTSVAQLSLGGVSIVVNHYPVVAKGLAASGLYGMVCYGHDHIPHEEWVGDCLLLNPGDLMGMKGKSTLAIVDLPSREVGWFEL